MPVRKTTAVASVLGLAALALVGCSAAPATPETCGRTDDSALAAVDVSGDFGPDMTVDAPEGFRSAAPEVSDVEVGDGPVIESMDQAVAFDVLFVDPATGAKIPLWDAPGSLTRVATPTAVSQQMLPAIEDALTCASEGSRIVASLGEEGVTPEFGQQLQSVLQQVGQSSSEEPVEAPELDSVLLVIDVNRVLPAAADGSPVYNAAFGMPSVVRDTDGVPGISVPVADAPTEQTTQTLLEGDGAEVSETDAVTVQYTNVSWSSRSVTTSTWESGAPETSTLAELPEGFAEALEGVTVGSQVLTIVPDESGDATVSVIDVLGAVPAA